MISMRIIVVTVMVVVFMIAMASAQFGPVVGPRYPVGYGVAAQPAQPAQPVYAAVPVRPIYKGPFGGMSPYAYGLGRR